MDVGYRFIDTACVYGNEKEVGEALKDIVALGTLKREDFFICTKVRCIMDPVLIG